MALRLIRQQSDTPNVTNKDDVQMVRYAYGGYNGVVKDFGEELQVEHIAGSGLFFKSGKIVLYGWEVDIDGSGYLLTIPYLSGTFYYSAYLEINAFQETAEIKAVYNPYAQHPNIDNGDDLTQIPNGVAKLLLYNFEVYNGTITTTEFEPKFKIIPYISEAFEDDRLTIKNATLAAVANEAKKVTALPTETETPDNFTSGTVGITEEGLYLIIVKASPSGSTDYSYHTAIIAVILQGNILHIPAMLSLSVDPQTKIEFRILLFGPVKGHAILQGSG